MKRVLYVDHDVRRHAHYCCEMRKAGVLFESTFWAPGVQTILWDRAHSIGDIVISLKLKLKMYEKAVAQGALNALGIPGIQYGRQIHFIVDEPNYEKDAALVSAFPYAIWIHTDKPQADTHILHALGVSK